MKEREIVLKFYEGDCYLPSYDRFYTYDLDDDDSFDYAYSCAAYQLYEVCDKNPRIRGRIEKVAEV